MDLFSEIESFVNAANTTAKDVKSQMANMGNTRSIVNASKDLIVDFPCLVTNTIPIGKAQTATRTMECVYASFLQVVISNNPFMNISKTANPKEYLNQFYSNIRMESVDDYIRDVSDEADTYLERFYDGKFIGFASESGDQVILFNATTDTNLSFLKKHEQMLTESMRYFDLYPIPNVGNSKYYTEAIAEHNYTQKDVDKAYNMFAQSKNSMEMKDIVKSTVDMGKVLRPPSLLDNDVKKANDLKPYMMQVRVSVVNNNREFLQFLDFIVGVKCIMHSIPSEDICVNIVRTIQNSSVFFNFIKWTTGEKALVKDLLLKVDDIKFDTVLNNSYGSRWFSTLRRMKSTSAKRRALMMSKQLLPMSTLIISGYEVDTIKSQYGFDLRDPKFGKKLVDNLFLMGFMIIDDANEVIDIMYDGSSSFQTYSIDELERETTMSSNRLGREITRMISH